MKRSEFVPGVVFTIRNKQSTYKYDPHTSTGDLVEVIKRLGRWPESVNIEISSVGIRPFTVEADFLFHGEVIPYSDMNVVSNEGPTPPAPPADRIIQEGLTPNTPPPIK